MKFHFYASEDTQPDIYDRDGEPLDLPLIATSVETRIDELPLVTLTLRARFMTFNPCGADGWPELLYFDTNLVERLGVSHVRYESGYDPGTGTFELDIQLGPDDEATYE